MQIRRLRITNFRCIEDLTWLPEPGMNVVIGPGDAGKTAILDAIALALAPTPVGAARETDYRDLNTDVPFVIELVVGALSEQAKAVMFPPPLWGWRDVDQELLEGPRPEAGVEEVVLVQAKGGPDLGVTHELLQPGADPRTWAPAQRAAFSMWSVGVSRAPQAELRMARGTLLDRALGGDALRVPAIGALRAAATSLAIPEAMKHALERMGETFEAAGVPAANLGLGVIPATGQSPVTAFGLTSSENADTPLPFGVLGRGTQQIAMVALASARAAEGAVAVADEIETGLEPYRQRQIVGSLRSVIGTSGQALITTHSPAVLSCLGPKEVTRVARSSGSPRVIHLGDGRLTRLLQKDPEALLSRLIVVCEGVTEVGILGSLLRTVGCADGRDLDALGVHLADGRGHEPALGLLEALHLSGVPTIGFVDEEDFATGTRERLRTALGLSVLGFTGASCTEEAVLNALAVEDFEGLVALPGRHAGPRMTDSRLQQLGHQLKREGKAPVTEICRAVGVEPAREALWRTAHRKKWFKSRAGGEALATFAHARLGRDAQIMEDVRGVWRAISKHVG